MMHKSCSNCGALIDEVVPLIPEIIGYCDGPGTSEGEYVTSEYGCDYWRPVYHRGD